MQEWIAENSGLILGYALRVAGVLTALWGSFKLGAWLESRVRTGLVRREFDEALSIFFGNLVRWLFILAAVLACLSVFGVETTSFAAILGAAGLAVGLAFQGTLSNFAAGLMLLTFRPFSLRDYVEVADEEGHIAEIGLFVTTMDTLDNRRIILPNNVIVGAKIENRTFHAARRVDIDVGVSYSADLDETRRVLREAAEAIPGVHPSKAPHIFLKGLGASSVDWQVRVWCDPHDYWDVWDATVRASKQALDRAGLSIPFPQLDVHVHKFPRGDRHDG